jgi:hypothetical protein
MGEMHQTRHRDLSSRSTQFNSGKRNDCFGQPGQAARAPFPRTAFNRSSVFMRDVGLPILRLSNISSFTAIVTIAPRSSDSFDTYLPGESAECFTATRYLNFIFPSILLTLFMDEPITSRTLLFPRIESVNMVRRLSSILLLFCFATIVFSSLTSAKRCRAKGNGDCGDKSPPDACCGYQDCNAACCAYKGTLVGRQLVELDDGSSYTSQITAN